jgi:Cu(I)/Ag(I) efflux system membrane fusion protein
VGFVTASEGRIVSLTARYSGWIEKVTAETGQLVEKGRILATVFSPEVQTLQQSFLSAARWTGRREPPAQGTPQPSNDLERDARERLLRLGLASQDIAELLREGKETSTVNVRSPARGHVARRSAIAGVYVQPGTELFQVVDLSSVWVIADVYEGELGRVKVGQRATFALAAWPGETFSGSVTFVYPALNPATRTLQARLELENPELKLRPGMYGDVSVDVGAADGVVVPREALVDTGEVQYVFVSRGAGRFEPRRVRAGLASGDDIAILDGLAEGERVVSTATFLLDSESRLRAALSTGAGH